MPPNQWQLDGEHPTPPILPPHETLRIDSRQTYQQSAVFEQGSTTHTPAAWDAIPFDTNSGSSLYPTAMAGQAHTLSTAGSDYPEFTDGAASGLQTDFFRDMHPSTEMSFSGISSYYPDIDAQSNHMAFTPSLEGADMIGLDVWPNAPAGFEYVRFFNSYV